MTGHSNTGRFDLLGANFAALDGLQTKFTKIQGTTAMCETTHFAFLLLAKFYFFGAKHNTDSCCEFCGARGVLHIYLIDIRSATRDTQR
jgi:hypothetical protein